jgi:hypothetical protein
MREEQVVGLASGSTRLRRPELEPRVIASTRQAGQTLVAFSEAV